ncbi:hypothetical protein O0I10_000097 [Lichtheimia ornata]|uniref:Rho GTPase activation protein n=1 Tax=Lichtheimia ornata TaxID=688661 RepID=A0AAD7Y4U0_9FUNG|nr:uncharacterized protein O0I10_000097 [Lichtheimia ornata]KAJ8663823.1 hypothetical protein O0I10_000097 [Lichtheimia ornata]
MSRPLSLSQQSPEFKGISAFNIIYEAGLDSDSRPILVLNACNLPDPNSIDYDLILAFILTRLDEFVENDYVLVFFSSPAKYRPPWMWLLRAYRALDRKYKKNLKALYVVHLTRTYRIIFDLANRITSPKFARKLHYLSSLQELFGAVRLSSKFIPRQVIDYDTNLPPIAPSAGWGSSQKLGVIDPVHRPLPSKAFGLTPEHLAQLDNAADTEKDTYVPSIVRQIVDHLEARGMDKEGLFRKSPASEELSRVKKAFNRGEKVDLTQHDINVAASLLKVFLKELPDPLIPSQLCTDLGKLPEPETCPDDVLKRVKESLQQEYNNRPYQRNLLVYLVRFLVRVVQHADKNRMTAHNIAVVFAPNLIHDGSDSNAMSGSQQEAIANAAMYMKRVNEGMALIQLLIVHHEKVLPV